MVKILVVEDDEKMNQIICTYLVKNDYEARGCTNPLEAYDLLFAETYDLIISDIMMPKVDGFDFAKEIRQKNPVIPILFITALDDFSSKKKGFQAGVDDYMVTLSRIIDKTGIWLLVCGGGIYLIGLLFYGLGSKRTWMHTIFHVFCLAGSVLHCICVGAYVI